MTHRVVLLCTLIFSSLALLTIADPPKASQRFTPGALGISVPLITSHKELGGHVGHLVAIRGPLSQSKVKTILGVEVGNPKDLTSDDAYAVGILGHVETTADDIAEANLRSGPIANRGAGTSYILYFDLAGKLADARAWPATEEEQTLP